MVMKAAMARYENTSTSAESSIATSMRSTETRRTAPWSSRWRATWPARSRSTGCSAPCSAGRPAIGLACCTRCCRSR
jgi:hypothetical protein